MGIKERLEKAMEKLDSYSNLEPALVTEMDKDELEKLGHNAVMFSREVSGELSQIIAEMDKVEPVGYIITTEIPDDQIGEYSEDELNSTGQFGLYLPTLEEAKEELEIMSHTIQREYIKIQLAYTAPQPDNKSIQNEIDAFGEELKKLQYKKNRILKELGE